MKKRLIRAALCLLFAALCGVASASAEENAPAALVISEVVSANTTLLPQEKEYYDLVELCNVGSEPVLLSDYYLSDKKSKPQKFQLPERTLKPGACYVIYASGLGEKNHANFKISSQGENLYLFTAGGEIADRLKVPALPPNVSYGRWEDGLYYYAEPTVGKPNGKGASHMLDAPEASEASGLYDRPFSVTLQGSGSLLYTLDGSDPLQKGVLYDGTPIPVSETTILRAASQEEGALSSTISTWHYLFDADQYELPILSISSRPGTVTGKNGLYEKWNILTRITQAHVCFIENGEEQFQTNCGLKLHGQGSRALPKKSFQLRFSGKYGADTLQYKLFADSDLDEFDSLVLRSGSEDYNRAFLRDEFLTSLTAEAMPEVLCQAYRPVNLYLDGAYYGIYFIRERFDDSYVSSHLGGGEDEADMVKGWSICEHGDIKDWNALVKYCRRNDLSVEENYQYVASQLCLESFMDYYIARAYSGDRDYANIRHCRSRGGDGLWRIANFDLDWGFGTNPACFSETIGSVKDSRALNTVVVNALLKNEGFRTQMLERLRYHLLNTYAPERVLAHLESMADELRHDMPYDRERWRLSMEKWEEHLQFLRDFIQSDSGSRVATMIQDARRAFRMTDEEYELYFGDIPGAE